MGKNDPHPDYGLGMERWLWVTQPDFWANLAIDGSDDGLAYEWTCDRRSEHGDLALLYRADPAKDIAHLFRIESSNVELWETDHPYIPGQDAWWCDASLLYTLRHPIGLADLRRTRDLADWPAVAVNMHSLVFSIDPAQWTALLGLAKPQDRIALRRHGGP
jgi:hypothetical protein